MASNTRLEIDEGAQAVVAVRLAKLPMADVEVSVQNYLSDPSISASPAVMNFTPGDWEMDQSVSIVAAQDQDGTDEGATIRLASPGVLPTTLRVTAVNDDQPAGSPRAIISLPRNGDTVSGAGAEFFSDGLDDGTVVRAVFLLDGVTLYIDRQSSGHYHVGGAHNLWDTTLVSDGDHLLTMRVYDGQGRWGAQSIKVKVRN